MNDLKGNDNRIIKERPRYTKNEKMAAEDEYDRYQKKE